MLRIFSFIFIYLLLFYGCKIETSTLERVQFPNVILIQVDDLGRADLPHYGNPFNETPMVSKLIKNSYVFNQAYSSSPICSPSRAALFTSLSPARLGITNWIIPEHFDNAPSGKKKVHKTLLNKILYLPSNVKELKKQKDSLAQFFKRNGYKTAIVGKWHLGLKEGNPLNHGFDENYGGGDIGEPPSYYDPYENQRSKYGNKLINLPTRKKGEFLTDREAYESLSFIDRNKENPFFLMLNHYAVHTPIQAKKPLLKKYEKKLKLISKKNRKIWRCNSKYATMLESVDQCLAKIVEKLSNLKLLEKTLIIFTSDHGGNKFYGCNYPLRGYKGTAYEGGNIVPLFFYWKGKLKATESIKLVVTMDLLPSLANLLSMPTLAENKYSFFKENYRDFLVWHFPHERYKKLPYSSIRQNNWKLIKYYQAKKNKPFIFELFNLKNDPYEKNNLSKKKENIVQKLDRIMLNYLRKEKAKIPYFK